MSKKTVQTTAPAAKKERKAPVMTEATKGLAQLIADAGLDLAQLRLLEAEVKAQKRAKTPKAGESKSAIAKAKSMDKHAASMAEAKRALVNGQEAKAREFLGVLSGVALQAIAGELKLKGRSKFKNKAELLNAIMGHGLVVKAKAA